ARVLPGRIQGLQHPTLAAVAADVQAFVGCREERAGAVVDDREAMHVIRDHTRRRLREASTAITTPPHAADFQTREHEVFVLGIEDDLRNPWIQDRRTGLWKTYHQSTPARSTIL